MKGCGEQEEGRKEVIVWGRGVDWDEEEVEIRDTVLMSQL